MDPTNPRILYAAMWHHGRKPWYIKSGGEGGGIYKSINSGESWKKLGVVYPGSSVKWVLTYQPANPPVYTQSLKPSPKKEAYGEAMITVKHGL